tara:strand:- start:1983 stop:2147 length:165 start_codon:yes stop_codon:yes gene_type:complete
LVKLIFKKETIRIKLRKMIELKEIFSGNDKLLNLELLSFKAHILNERKKYIIKN